MCNWVLICLQEDFEQAPFTLQDGDHCKWSVSSAIIIIVNCWARHFHLNDSHAAEII